MKKINEARADVCAADWTPDKTIVMKKDNTVIPYISVSKMKATLAPIFQKHGLEFVVRCEKPEKLEAVGGQPSHWMVCMTLILVDVDSGESTYDIIYGEASDLGDKAITKAESYAFKQWLSTKFMLADGMDPERDSGDDVPGFLKTRDDPETRNKVLSQGVKPDKAPEKPAEPKKKSEKASSSSKDGKASDGGEEGKDGKFEPAAPQKKAMEKIAEAWKKAAEEGRVDAEEYNRMSMEYASVASPADVMKFIQTYRGRFQ